MSIKKILSIALCIICLTFVSAFAVNGAGANKFVINELSEMEITLPDNLLAVTRDSKEDDDYFRYLGLDHKLTMASFESGDIYLQGMDNPPTVTVTVTMTKTEESKGINNYNLLGTDELAQITRNFINQSEYVSCTPDQLEKLIWFNFETVINANGKNIKAYQANTVYNGMSVNITFQRIAGNVTAEDYREFSNIVSSVKFNKEGIIGEYALYILLGGAALLIIITVLLVVVIKKVKKKHRLQKNDKIIEELAGKYNINDNNRKPDKKNQSYSEESYVDISASEEDGEEDLEKTIVFEKARVQKPEEKFEESPEEKHEESFEERYGSEFTVDDLEKEIDNIIDDIRKNDSQGKDVVFDNNEASYREDSEDSENGGDVDNSDDFMSNEEDGYADGEDGGDEYTDEEAEESYVENLEAESESTEKSVFAELEVENTEEEDFLNDEELVRAEVKRTKFNDSDDFFEESPYKIKGVISSKEIDDAEDYDVIEEIEKRAVEIEKEKPAKETKFVDTTKSIALNIVSGAKYFFVHCGYFCTNVHRLIKRKRAVAKRKKAEEARRERARMRAERQQRQGARDGELVQVHRRSERRVPPTASQRNSRGSNNRR